MSTEPTSEAAFFSTIRSWGIVRSEQRVFGGVLGGVGARIGMAPAPARIIFVVIAIVTGGLSLLAYAAAWSLLPDAEGRIVIQDFGRGRPNVGALVAIGIMAFIGFLTLGQFGFGSPWRSGSFHVFRDDGMFGTGLLGTNLGHAAALFFAVLIPLAVLGGLAALIVWAVRSGNNSERSAQGYARLPDGSLPDAPVDAAPSDVTPSDVDPSPAADVVPETAAAAVGAGASTAHLIAVGTPPLPSFTVPAPPVYTAPPTPPRPRVPGPGKMGYLMALAWIPITAAITLYLATNHHLVVFPVVAAGVIYVAGLGLILIITALRGRKLGFLGFVSVLALIPVGVAIAFATDLREHYASGDWTMWVREQGLGNQDWEPSVAPSTSYIEAPAFNPADAFSGYATVAIAGQCSSDFTGPAPDATGNISLAEVTGPTTLTIATDVTRVVIPAGTNLAIVAPSASDMQPYVGVTWVDRGVTCSMTSGVENLVTLNNPDAPLLTLELADPNTVGQFDIYIEEK